MMGLQRNVTNWLTADGTLIQKSSVVDNFLFGFWQLCLSSAQRPSLVTQLCRKWIVIPVTCWSCSLQCECGVYGRNVMKFFTAVKEKKIPVFVRASMRVCVCVWILKPRRSTSGQNNKLAGQMIQKTNKPSKKTTKKQLPSLRKSDFTCV